MEGKQIDCKRTQWPIARQVGDETQHGNGTLDVRQYGERQYGDPRYWGSSLSNDNGIEIRGVWIDSIVGDGQCDVEELEMSYH